MDAGFGYGADGAEVDAAGGFDDGAVADDGHRLAHRVYGHIVEHYDMGAGVQGFAGIVQGFDFDLYADGVRGLAEGQLDYLAEAHFAVAVGF